VPASFAARAAGAFDAAHAALVYAPPVDQLVQAFKYRGRLALAGLFAEKLAARILATGSPRPDYLLAMPASQARQRERGYNQAQELARALGRLLHLPLANPPERVIDRPPQSALPWKERAKNVRGVFRAKGSVEGMSLAIVDDVMTTAASAAELAKTLKAGGARRVEVWVAARTLPPRS
jgi:ComF family protein